MKWCKYGAVAQSFSTVLCLKYIANRRREYYRNFYKLNCIPPIYLHWDFRNVWHSPVWNIQFDFNPSLNWEKIPVWNINLAKSKIPVRVVKNVISKWTKMEFPGQHVEVGNLWLVGVGSFLWLVQVGNLWHIWEVIILWLVQVGNF